MTVAINGTSGLTFNDASTQNTAPKVGMVNRIINGAMTIFQRGTAATADAQYSIDRWRFVKGNDATESVSQNTDAPAGFINSLRNTISTGDATIGAGQYSGFEQSIEGFNVADLGWGTANASPVTLSFLVRSSVTGQYTGSLRNNDFSRKCPFNYTINAANTWEYKTVSVVGDTTGTWLTNNGIGITVALYAALGSNFLSGSAGVWGGGFGCGTPVNGIASNGNIFAITGVQLEKGSTATSFDYRPFGTELALCQRYFETSDGVQGFVAGSTGFTTNSYFNTAYYKVTKRVASTIVLRKNNGNIDECQMFKNGTEFTGSGPSIEINTTHGFSGEFSNASVTDAGLLRFQWTASSEL